MKASVLTQFGPPEVLQVMEVSKPSPGDQEVLVRVRAASVGFGDTLVRNLASVTPRKFHMPFLFWLISKIVFGIWKPKVAILGSEFSGEVEAVGSKVTRFKAGDRVFGYCGPGMGAYAEYLCVPEGAVIATKPANLTFEQAAAIPYGAVMALGVLKKAQLQPGQKVLVVGASGGIGPAVLQLAKHHFGAQVSGVCSTARLDYIRSMGAEVAIDYTHEDFTDRAESYDVIIDILGKCSFRRCRRVLKPTGRLLYVSFKSPQLLWAIWTAIIGGQKAVCVLVNEKQEDLLFLKERMEEGALTAQVDRSFPLEQAAQAHRYAESGAKSGYVVVTVQTNGQ